MKVFDVVAGMTWAAMALFLVLGVGALAMRPAPPAIYTSDTGLCDSGC